MPASEEAYPSTVTVNPETGEAEENPHPATLDRDLGNKAVEQTITGTFEPSEQIDHFDHELFQETTRVIERPAPTDDPSNDH